jgi:Prealbumin-like fold domain
MTRIIGPARSRRRRRSLFGAIGSFLLLTLVLVPSAQAVLPGSPSNFESDDGNMTIEGGVTFNDWNSVVNESTYAHIEDVFNSTADDSFTSGQKQDTTCPGVSGHKNPAKDDFTDVASFSEVNTEPGGDFEGDTYLYGATIRFAANGNASENVELKQAAADDLCPGTTLTVRTTGDKLIAIDYLNGGTNVQFNVLTWIGTQTEPCFVGNHTAPCWGQTVLSLSDADAEGQANQSPITALNNLISGDALVTGQFAEFGINLTEAGIIPGGECETFNQTVWESRASGSSFVSTTKDVAIEDNPISNCASVSVRKIGSDGLTQTGVVFTLYAGDSTDPADAVGTCTVDPNGDCLPSFTDLNPGDYTLDETTTPAGYTKDPDLPFLFTLAAGETASFEFTNTLQNGAIRISKTAKHADDGSSPNLVAGFTVTDSGAGTHPVSTNSSGSGCVDGIPPGLATVSETGPPTGYSAGPDVQVTVVAGTTCANANGVLASFDNIPLTNITVSVDSQVDGGTSSTITCGSEPTVTTDADGDGSLTVNDLEPNAPDGIVCTIVIDP